jgi:DNA-binding transcriptional ArsR family regulator
MKPEMIEEIADLFKALSEPTRLHLLFKLMEGEMTVTRLADFSGTSMANVSKHLTFMRRSGIVSRKKTGNQVFYTIRNQKIFDICNLVCEDIENRFRSVATPPKRKRGSPSRIPTSTEVKDVAHKPVRDDIAIEQPGILGLNGNPPG